MITLRVTDENPITLKYVEAKVKPETECNVTPEPNSQTILPTPGTTFGQVNVSPIPSEYIIPTGEEIITSNGVHNVAPYERVNVNVSVVPQLVLLDEINVEDLEGQVNTINIDLSNYNLTGYSVIYIVVENVVSSTSDWLYFNAERYASCYFDDSRTTHNARKIIQYYDGTNWRSAIGLTRATGKFPSSGDPLSVDIIRFNFYNSNTTFVSGKFLIYAI